MSFYVESGTGRQIESSNLQGIDPSKTYTESGTGQQIPGAQLLTAPPSPAPTAAAPAAGATGSSLVDFANALSQVTTMAKQHRNALSLGIMAPGQGTMMASDFNGILSNLNNASDSYASDITKNAMTAAAPPKLTEVSAGATLYDPSSNKAVYTAPKASASSGSGGSTDQGVDEVQHILKTGTTIAGTQYGNPSGDDGFVDPSVYLKLYDNWIKMNGPGSGAQFVKKYPPKNYINPGNSWIADEFSQRGISWTAPKSTSSSTSSLSSQIDAAFSK